MSQEFVLPRPGDLPSTHPPLPAPSESLFTHTFGALLPPAKFLQTPTGKAAYYELLPSSPVSTPTPIDRVLLIHGVQTPALGLLPLALALRSAYPSTHFVLFDHWGHGLSETPCAPFEPGLFLDLIDALLEKLDWVSAHWVGYSFGGVLTAEYINSRTSKVKSFTLVASAGLMRSAKLTPEERQHLRGGGDEVATRKWVHSWLEGGDLVVPEDWEERVKRGEVVAEAIKAWQLREHEGHAAAVVGVVRDGRVFDNHRAIGQAVGRGIPCLAVLGERDGVCGVEDMEEVGVSNVVVIPGVGHGVVRERASEVAGFICDFWRSLEEDGESRG